MKYLITILPTAFILSSCTTYKCYPSKGSRDYATVTIKDGKEIHQVWRKDLNGRILISECIK